MCSDPTAAIARARSDDTCPGQRFATAIIAVCSRRERTQQLGCRGNETADEWARSAAESVGDSIARDFLRETSFAHKARMAAEARSAVVERWIVDHVDRRCRYKPPKGQKP